MSDNPAAVRLADLVEHADYLDGDMPLAQAQAEFARRRRRFLGVLRDGRFLGLANGGEISEKLGNQFGHALFGRTPVAGHLMADALRVAPGLSITELLKLTAVRSERCFYHDVAVVGSDDVFVGLIPMHSLVRLQTALLLANLSAVESQRLELADRNRRMEDDLRMARQVQLALLPAGDSRVVWQDRAVVSAHHYEPADTIGGDFLSIFSPGEGVLAGCVCDVMGHGVRPALITAILRALLEEAREAAAEPGALLTQLNRGLRHVLQSAGELIFVTAACAVVDLRRGELRYAQAGHPPPLHWSAAERVACELRMEEDAAGPALGFFNDFDYVSVSRPFAPGDALLIYTDGIVEVADAAGEEFGVARLRAALAERLAAKRPSIPPGLVAAARDFSVRTTFPDDVCLLLLCRSVDGDPA